MIIEIWMVIAVWAGLFVLGLIITGVIVFFLLGEVKIKGKMALESLRDELQLKQDNTMNYIENSRKELMRKLDGIRRDLRRN